MSRSSKSKHQKKETAAPAGLAGMVKRGFDHIDERFDYVDLKLSRIEENLIKNLERRLSRVEEALEFPSRR